MVIPKKNSGKVRICVNMREANKAVQRGKHVMPTIDDLITDLNGATTVITLDLKAGYHQLELDPASRHITTFSTLVLKAGYHQLELDPASRHITTFSTLDLKAGYHQLELDPASRHITTFSTLDLKAGYHQLELDPASRHITFSTQRYTDTKG